MSSAALEALAREIDALTWPELRLAAGLLEHKRPELAKSIIEKVSVELGAALALQALKDGGRRG